MHRTHFSPHRFLHVLAALSFAGAAGAAPTSTATYTTGYNSPLRINEVLAARSSSGSGSASDQIELHNSGSTAISLAGKILTDATSDPARRFVFPTGTSIPAGGYLVIFADTNASTPTELHTGFALDAEGDVVQLHDSTSGNPLMDEVRFGYQVADYSISRTGAGANVWALTTPTLGAANGNAVTLAEPGALKINEWAGNVVFRLDHDMIELFNSAAQPVALTGVRLTDDVAPGRGYTLPRLSFIGTGTKAFLALYKGDYLFGLNGDRATVTLLGENNEQIDQIMLIAQPDDRSAGRSPDGSATIRTFDYPSPGISNQTPFPAQYESLLRNLRITELMYDPKADSNASQFEFVELQNIGSAPLDIGGVRFTNGIEHTFDAGTILAPGAFLVVANDRSSFRSRYPQVPESVMARGGFNGSLANDGETIYLTLPAPWKVHILNFRYSPTWVPSASRGGHSIVPVSPASTPPQNWGNSSTWRASAAENGSPGTADPGVSAGGFARLSNLSVMTEIATAGDSFQLGYVVGGAGTSGTKPILIRAAGPSLGAAPFNIPGTLADPKLELYANNAKNDENDNWGGTATLSNAFVAVGAFAYVNATSRDSAVLAQIAPGNNSVVVSGVGNVTGTVLAEFYDSTPIASMTATTPRLVNVSVLKHIGSLLTAGFVIDGNAAKKVLIRAVGPTIGQAPFNVPGAVSDPQLTLFSGTTAIGSNNNWGGTGELTAAFTQVGAFSLPSDSRDAALLQTLQPGAYTVQVTGVGNTTGMAIVEVYEVP